MLFTAWVPVGEEVGNDSDGPPDGGELDGLDCWDVELADVVELVVLDKILELDIEGPCVVVPEDGIVKFDRREPERLDCCVVEIGDVVVLEATERLIEPDVDTLCI